MGVYFSLTALHALHVIAGIGVILLDICRGSPGTFWQPILHARRSGWALLASGRYDLDIPLSASLSDSLTPDLGWQLNATPTRFIREGKCDTFFNSRFRPRRL